MDATDQAVDAPVDTHQYITDAGGKRTHVVLNIEEYEELLEELWHWQVLAERRGGETVSLEEMKRQFGLG